MTFHCPNCGSKLQFISLPSSDTPFECFECNTQFKDREKLKITLEILDSLNWKKLEGIDKAGLFDPLEHSRDRIKRVKWRMENRDSDKTKLLVKDGNI